MSDETCPECGAMPKRKVDDTYDAWQCDSTQILVGKYKGRFSESSECLRRQLAQELAKNERLKGLVGKFLKIPERMGSDDFAAFGLYVSSPPPTDGYDLDAMRGEFLELLHECDCLAREAAEGAKAATEGKQT